MLVLNSKIYELEDFSKKFTYVSGTISILAFIISLVIDIKNN